ncbi:hypothetical protein NQZ68_036884 [Dissostichus eleginoides]|nr:hypothetical protein NQZ68_036884 [Dissostichus eleginoides]
MLPVESGPSSAQVLCTSSVDIFPGDTSEADPVDDSEADTSLASTSSQGSTYPSTLQISSVADALVEKFPCLKEPGSFSGMYGWQQRLKYKMHNYRAKLKSRKYAFPEIEVNTLKRKQAVDAAPAKNVKRPKKAEVNYLPQHPIGEDEDTLEKERLELIDEANKRNNARIIREKMSKTFSIRRVEVVTLSPRVSVFKERWPGLFNEAQIKEEFRHITTLSLEETFMRKLDGYTPRLLKLMRAKGGDAGSRMLPLLSTIDEDEHENVMDQTMKVLVTHDARDGGPADVSIVIEGDRVLTSCGNETKACALLMGFIYALNLEYPKKLKYTFEVFQKLFLELDGAKLLKKIQSLKCKLME